MPAKIVEIFLFNAIQEEYETKYKSEQQNIQVQTSKELLELLDVEITPDLSVLQQARSVNVVSTQLGGRVDLVPVNTSDAFERLMSFKEEVVQRPVPFNARIADYDDVPTSRPVPLDLDIQHKREVIRYCGRLYSHLMTVRSNILYISGHRNEFINVGNYPLNEYLTKINKDLNAIKRAVDTCVNDIQSCNNPEVDADGKPIVVDYDLPERRWAPPGTRPVVPDLPLTTIRTAAENDRERRVRVLSSGKPVVTLKNLRSNSPELTRLREAIQPIRSLEIRRS